MSIMPAPAPSVLENPEPTQDERCFAFLAEFLQPFVGFIAPIAILILKKDSRFVKFHALQVLFWHIAFLILWVGAITYFIFSMMKNLPAAGREAQPPKQEFARFMAVWFAFCFGWLANILVAVTEGVLAYQGRRGKIPLIGDLARMAVED